MRTLSPSEMRRRLLLAVFQIAAGLVLVLMVFAPCLEVSVNYHEQSLVLSGLGLLTADGVSGLVPLFFAPVLGAVVGAGIIALSVVYLNRDTYERTLVTGIVFFLAFAVALVCTHVASSTQGMFLADPAGIHIPAGIPDAIRGMFPGVDVTQASVLSAGPSSLYYLAPVLVLIEYVVLFMLRGSKRVRWRVVGADGGRRGRITKKS